MVYLSKPYPFKFFKDCLPEILLGAFLNILSHMYEQFCEYIYDIYFIIYLFAYIYFTYFNLSLTEG